MNTFVLNGKNYKAKEFDFNTICELEEMGVNIGEANKKPMSIVRAYFAVCAGRDKDFAGTEIQAHVLSGGTLEDLMKSMSEKMENSDFFRTLNKTEEAETGKSEKKEK